MRLLVVGGGRSGTSDNIIKISFGIFLVILLCVIIKFHNI